MALVRDAVRKVVWKTGKIVTSKGEIPEGQGLEYRDYFDYTEPVSQIPPHRVLAINRGDKEGPLKVRLEVSRPDVEAALFSQLPLEGHPQHDLFHAAAIDALERLILPSMEREVRRDLTEAAEKHAVEVFARNLGSLLLQPPIPKQVVLAIDPGFKNGCKVAVLDPGGHLLDQAVIFPHPPQNRRSDAKLVLKDLVGKHQVGVVAIGNGTACRETEELVAEIIAEGTRFSQGDGVEAPPAPEPAAGEADALPDGEPAEAARGCDRRRSGSQASRPMETLPVAAAWTLASPSPCPCRRRKTRPSRAPRRSKPGNPTSLEPSPTRRRPRRRGMIRQCPHTRRARTRWGTDPAATRTAATNRTSLPPRAQSRCCPRSPAAPPIPTSRQGARPRIPARRLHRRRRALRPARSTPIPGVPRRAASHRTRASPRRRASRRRPSTISPFPTTGTPTRPGREPARRLNPRRSPRPCRPRRSPTTGRRAAPSSRQWNRPRPATISLPPGSRRPRASRHRSRAPARRASRRPRSRGGSGPHVRPASAPGETPRPGAVRVLARRGSRGRQSSTPPPPPSPPRPHPADAQLAQLAYVIVNEAGASVYSTSQVGRDELPEYDATLRGTVSIGRRLQDPLSELVKIEPQNIGVGLYQHDVNPKQLKETLESVIASCVNFVGVDLNTASVSLLRHVSGLNQLTARRIVDFRKERGPFARREQLMEVEGIGPATFTQAAGFLKLLEGENPLDRTWVHPESYPAALKLLEKFGFTADVVRDKVRLPELRAQLAQADVPALAAELGLGEFTLRDIIEALARPERDPRDDLPKPIFKKGVLKLEDLVAGMELKGTVLNVVDFGAFVDIGLKDSGLVHISQLANRYVKSPHDVVSVGDVVTVWVMGVDQERKRVSLTMVKPGTERHRGPQGGGRRGGPGGEPRDPNREREGRGPGQGRARRRTRSASARLGADLAAGRGPLGRRAGRGPGPSPRSGAGSWPGSRPRSRAGRAPARGCTRRCAGTTRPRSRTGRSRGSARSVSWARRRPAASFRSGSRSRRARPRPAGPPRRPGPPPPPLSKDALAGNVPLRTFGQLKQLWQARTEGPGPDESGPPDGPQQPADAQANAAPEPPLHAPQPPESPTPPIPPEPETPAQSE